MAINNAPPTSWERHKGYVHPKIEPFPPAPTKPRPDHNCPKPNYDLRECTYEELFYYMTVERGVPKGAALAAIKLHKKTPELLAICFFGHENPECVESADQCRDRLRRKEQSKKELSKKEQSKKEQSKKEQSKK